MRVVLQRVLRASVTVADETIGRMEQGLLLLLGIHRDDGPEQVRWLADKIAGLRIFSDADGKMNQTVQEINGSILVVSQFTLYGRCDKGRRPSFTEAASPEIAEPLYDAFINGLRAFGIPVATGKFGADMQVELVNDGPVTLVVDSPKGV